VQGANDVLRYLTYLGAAHHESFNTKLLNLSVSANPTNMALPVTESVVDCADLSQTVLPYISQLYELPRQLLQSYNDPAALSNIYLSTNPLVTAFAFSLFISPIFLLVSELNRNYSQVDRLWSILPTIYNAHYVAYAHLAGLPTQRLHNLLAVSTIWSVSCASHTIEIV
jgi:hypothetical protein